MARSLEPELDAPIPGMGLTHEVGARPWQTPSQMSTVEDALDFYIPRIGDPKYTNQVLGLLESGTSLTTIAETMTLVGAMEGKHNIDVGVLVNPIIVEYLKGMGDVAGIKYNIDNTESTMDLEVSDKMVEDAVLELQGAKPVTPEQQEEITKLAKETVQEQKKGLMARPKQDEEVE
tara:strand:- start:221 stop:748 length:528 start_codon:yes stop_codon:yes gene_type:complete